MKKKIPLMKEYMTFTPHTIGADIPVTKAQELMREYHIRHLPVLTRGKIVGVISDRNVKEALVSKGGEEFVVEDVMMPDPYSVSGEAPLDSVLSAMADEKYGCAIIEDKVKKAVGIFTTVDACRAFKEWLHDSCQK